MQSNLQGEVESKLITLTWNKENVKEVAEAEKKFLHYLRKGWIAISKTDEEGSIQIFNFDPNLEKILLVPLVEGG